MAFARTLICSLVLTLCTTFICAQSQPQTLNLTFTTIDVPGAGVTGVYGINSGGDVVGYYGTSSDDPNKHGFLYGGELFTYLDYPGADATFAYGINDSGTIVGSAEFNAGLTAVGFRYASGVYSQVQVGNNSTVALWGIASNGDVAGAAGTAYTSQAIELRGSKFHKLSVPGEYSYVSASGINKTGTAVGWADYDAFVCQHNVCQIVDYPGADWTANRGINDKGIIVGWYASSTCICGFALKNGQYFSFSYPGAAATFADGINGSGQVVGQYTFDYVSFHGFISSPITAADSE